MSRVHEEVKDARKGDKEEEEEEEDALLGEPGGEIEVVGPKAG